MREVKGPIDVSLAPLRRRRSLGTLPPAPASFETLQPSTPAGAQPRLRVAHDE